MLVGDLSTVRANRILQEADAISLALSGLTEEGQTQQTAITRELEAVAYDKHTERWERKKIALRKQDG